MDLLDDLSHLDDQLDGVVNGPLCCDGSRFSQLLVQGWVVIPHTPGQFNTIAPVELVALAYINGWLILGLNDLPTCLVLHSFEPISQGGQLLSQADIAAEVCGNPVVLDLPACLLLPLPMDLLADVLELGCGDWALDHLAGFDLIFEGFIY